ncbi:uncharacterized protein LOC129780155 [Toxorhynchites rutilus septentrionalis]|uniref:uncharacterized protein LOC129780155 n=1 Tax=Toxorhynchites rutilus septentrionalis TaxID=329112 RepID=UPI002478CD97|nr:uncharacterized protein LOC129780155 [Toxorhynchites rutilus septentrionalis]XP_055644112.1 uncharacterized protein LOC129780155 [Toxorhynchites rutilus septentrionalis]
MDRHHPRSPGQLRDTRSTHLEEDTQLIIEVSGDGRIEIISERKRLLSDINQSMNIERNIIYSTLHPAMYDHVSYRRDQHESDSELSFTTESPASEASESMILVTEEEMNLEDERDGATFSVPVIELPGEHENNQTISIFGKVQGRAVGAVVDPSTTVLMQMSSSDAVGYQLMAECLRVVNEMMENEESMVVLAPREDGTFSSKQAITDQKETTKHMVEMAEDVLERVQGYSRESILIKLQTTLGEILNQSEDTIVVHSQSRKHPAESDAGTETIVGFYRDGDETALLVQPVNSIDLINQSVSSSSEGKRVSLDIIEGFLKDSLISQENIIEQTLLTDPLVTAFQSGERIVSVFSFPNTSSGVFITGSKNISEMVDETAITQSLMDQFRKLVRKSSEKLLVQTHSDAERSSIIEQIKQELERSLESKDAECSTEFSVRQSDDKVIGVLQYSEGSIVIQTASKNWIKPKFHASPIDLISNLRMVICQFHLNNALGDEDLKCLATTIAQVFHSRQIELSEEFLGKPVLEKLRFITQQLVKPSEDEDHLIIINQIRETLEDIARCDMTGIRAKDYRPWDVLKTFFEGLIFDEDIESDSESVIYALRDGLLEILIKHQMSPSHALEDFVELLKIIPTSEGNIRLITSESSCSGDPTLTRSSQSKSQIAEQGATPVEVIQEVHDLSRKDEPAENRTVSFITLFQAFLLTLLRFIGSWASKLMPFLDRGPEETVQPERSRSRSLSKKPSVSFHLLPEDKTPSNISTQMNAERRNLNDVIDEFRKHLESTLGIAIPKADVPNYSFVESELSEDLTGNKTRMLVFLVKLLKESGKFRKVNYSDNAVHFELESVLGDYVWNENDGYATLSGNICDREESRGFFFNIRMVDLEAISDIESEIECIKEVRKLSDDDDRIVTELVPEIVDSIVAEIGSDMEDEMKRCDDGVAMRLQESFSRYFELVRNCIQESIEPIMEVLTVVVEKMTTVGMEKFHEIPSSLIPTSSPVDGDYAVELREDSCEVLENKIAEEVEYCSKAIQCRSDFEDFHSSEIERSSLQKSDMLSLILNDLDEIKRQLKVMAGMHQPTLRSSGTGTEEHYDEKDLSSANLIPSSAPAPEAFESIVTLTNLEEEQKMLSRESDGRDEIEQFISVEDCRDIFGTEQIETKRLHESILEYFNQDSPDLSVSIEIYDEPCSLPLVSVSSVDVSDADRPNIAISEEPDIGSIPCVQDQEIIQHDVVSIHEFATRESFENSDEIENSTRQEDEVPHNSQENNIPMEQQQRLEDSRSSNVEIEMVPDVQKLPEPPISEHINNEQDFSNISSDTGLKEIRSSEVSGELINLSDGTLDVKKTDSDQSRDTDPGDIQLIEISEILTNDQNVLSEKQQDQTLDLKEMDSEETVVEKQSLEKGPSPPSDSIVVQNKQREPLQQRNLKNSSISEGKASIPQKSRRLCQLALSYQCQYADATNEKFSCPVEIYSCHQVGPDQLIIHWKVAPQFLDRIDGYEIYVDGELRSSCFSRMRRTALIEGINIAKEHRIAVYSNPDPSVNERVQWAPGIFFYHL